MSKKRLLEKSLAVAAFVVASAIALLSLIIRAEHDIAANIGFVIAQFLTLSATILGIDYKFSSYGTQSTAGTAK